MFSKLPIRQITIDEYAKSNFMFSKLPIRQITKLYLYY